MTDRPTRYANKEVDEALECQPAYPYGECPHEVDCKDILAAEVRALREELEESKRRCYLCRQIIQGSPYP